MTGKDVVVFDPDGRSAGLFRQNVFSGWNLQHSESAAGMRHHIDETDAAVGIAVFNRGASVLPAEVCQAIACSDAEWIALVDPGAMRDPAFGQFILRNFHDYHTLPAEPARLAVTLGHAWGLATIRRSFRQHPEDSGRYGMTGRSPQMLALYRQIDKVVRAEAPVLLSGESGTGKELVARAIHRNSARAGGPFVAMNCGALPPSLIQSELFGHERGAFTGAHQRQIGNVEAANHGVLFLDEIGDLSLELQTNLLRFLQEKYIVRVGSTQHINVNVRVVAATHVDLQQAVKQGRFREDLFYRLNVLHLSLPALRERHGDIPLIADSVFRANLQHRGARVRGFSADALAAMERHDWPGNVRELINRVQRAVIMSENRLMTPADLCLSNPPETRSQITLEDARSNLEREVIESSLRCNRNNISQAARELGISRVTLYRLINRLNIVL